MPLSLDSVRALCSRHQEKLIDAILLLVALNLTSVIPGLVIFSTGAQVALLAVFALFAAPKVEANEGIWRRYRKLMPSYLGTAVAGGLFVGWWFALPRPLWWFAPLWLALTLLRRLLLLLLQQEKLIASLHRRRWEIPAGDLVILAYFTLVAPRWTLQPFLTWAAVVLGAGWLAVHWLKPIHLPTSPHARVGTWLAVTALPASWAGLAWFSGGAVNVSLVFAGWFAIALLVYRTAVQRWASTDAGTAEIARWLGLGMLVAFYFYPFARAGLHGAGDALYYATFLSDAIEQFRHGVFPVFVGQSEYQFNGSVVPIRVAPGFQYLGGLVDLLTARLLGAIAIQNILLTLTALGATFATYVTLRRQSVSGGIAWALTVLYLCCPGVLALVYVNDLYMSWLTIPLVPLSLVLGVRTFSHTGSRLYATLGGVLGVTWWLHAPIALWLTLVATILQLARLVWRRPAKRVLAAEMLCGAGAFLLIALYPVASSALYPADPTAGGASGGFAVPAEHVLQMLRENFPAAWLPVSDHGRKLSDFQLGYGLCAVAALSAWFTRRRELWVLTGIVVALVVLLLPIPAVNLALWRAMPDAVRAITNMWVMQRLCLVLAACVVALAASVWVSASARSAVLLERCLLVACLWSAIEALKFVRGSQASGQLSAGTTDRIAPENISLTRFSYGFFPFKPAYFTHGVTDPVLENRLLAADLRTMVSGNYEAAARSAQSSSTHSFFLVDGRFEADPKPVIEPGRRYLATLSSSGPAPTGTLVLEGRILQRVYGLPEYGEARAFGLTAGRNPSFPLSTSNPGPETLKVFFEPADRAAPGLTSGQMKLRLTEYDPAILPVQVQSWIPYRAKVTASQPLWLETPRAWQAGYEALIDGRPAEVQRSGEGLVSVAVPMGESIVEVRYVAPAGLRAAFWASFMALLAGALLSAVAGWRALFGRTTPAPATA